MSIWVLPASKKGLQPMAEGPCAPVPDTGSTAHNEAFNETLGSPARLPPAHQMPLGTAGTAGPMHAGCSISAPGGCASRPRVYRIRVKRLSTDTDSWEQEMQVTVCPGALRTQGTVGDKQTPPTMLPL